MPRWLHFFKATSGSYMALLLAMSVELGPAVAQAGMPIDSVINFETSMFSATEGEAAAIIPVYRDGSDLSPLQIEYAVTGGTAIPGSDFVSTGGTVSFAQGQREATLSISLLDDA